MSLTADEPKSSKVLSTALKAGIVVTMLVSAVAFLLFGSETSEVFVYSKSIDELVSGSVPTHEHRLRVEGELKPGSVRFRAKPCEWRFILTGKIKELPVRYPFCVVPDTFRDAKGVEVMVQGNLQDDGWFAASQLIPRCPSKYERAKLIQEGEKKPHGFETTPLTAPRNSSRQ